MHARKLLVGTLSGLLLGGCALSSQQATLLPASDAWLANSDDCCRDLSELPTTALGTRQEMTLAFGPRTPVHGFAVGKSPFHALKLPRQSGPLKLSWVSEVQRDDQGDLSLFAPTLLLLDVHGNITRRFDWRGFTYQPARGLSRDRLTLSFGVTPGDSADRVVVLTSQQALETSTELIHPARMYARARNLVEPKVKNPLAEHRASGEIELSVRPLGEEDGLLAPLLGRQENTIVVPAPTSPPSAADSTASESAQDDREGLDYRRMMRAALKAGDIALAMDLAERAERNGDKGARAWLAERLEVRSP